MTTVHIRPSHTNYRPLDRPNPQLQRWRKIDLNRAVSIAMLIAAAGIGFLLRGAVQIGGTSAEVTDRRAALPMAN